MLHFHCGCVIIDVNINANFGVAPRKEKMAKKKAGKSDDKTQVIAIAALAVAVVTMAIGFATYTQTLNINGTATMKQAKWDVEWCHGDAGSGLSGTALPTKVDGTGTYCSTFDGAFYNETVGPNLGEVSAITATDVTFDVELGLNDTYTFQVEAVNAGTIDAALKSIVLSNETTGDKTDMPWFVDYSVKYGSQDACYYGGYFGLLNSTTGANYIQGNTCTYSNVKLEDGESETVTVTVNFHNVEDGQQGIFDTYFGTNATVTRTLKVAFNWEQASNQ